MKYIFLTFILIFSACSIKNYELTQTKIVIIKSPKFKFSDLAYIRNSGKSLELELFMAGRSIETITINHLVCTSAGCLSRSGFNEEYLNENYPNDILQNILLAKPIYGEKSLVKTPDGFEQYIKTKDVDIKYVVTAKSTFFKDKKNKIIFKIKDTQ